MAADVKKFWPIIVYVFATWLNTDAMMGASLLKNHGKIPSGLALAIAALATLELIYSFWFWRWVVSQGPEIQKLRDQRQGVIRKNSFWTFVHGTTNWILDGILAAYRKVTNPENGAKRHIDRWGVLAVWVAGVNPIVGLPTRGPCCIFLGFYGRRREFLHLLAANLTHIFIVKWVMAWLLGH